jgi:macrolide-specific efflux system membrane fusion protein
VRRWIGRTLLLLAGAGGGWLGARQLEAGTEAPQALGGWQTGLVARRDIGATVLATGVIRPRVGAQVEVGSRASGVVKRLHVTVGDRVNAGQLLAELERVEFETQVERAEASRQSAASDLAWAEQEHERISRLSSGGHATAAELAQARRALELAQAKLREASAQVAAARVQLGYASITAPIGGVVGSVSTQEGETVAASFAAPTFLTIVDLSRLEVQAYVDETDIGRVEVGQRAAFRVDTWPDDVFEGRVTAVRPTAEIRDNVVNYITLIEFRNRPERLLRPEMTATITLTVEGRSGVQSLPNGALRRDSAGSYVMVVQGETVERRTVTLGFRGSEFTEVVEGVTEGERVLTGQGTECRAPDAQEPE